MNPLNTGMNKATWSAAANAMILLVNGRLPENIALDGDEIGWVMTVITFLVVYFTPNKKE